MILNLENITYGRLTVIRLSHIDKWRASNWVCKCQCGNEITTKSSSLKSGATQSCGCYAKEKQSKVNFINLIGKTFNRLTVTGIDRSKKRIKWICSCSCGNVISTRAASLNNGHTQSCGCLHKEINKINFTGKNNPRFNENLTDEDRKNRKERRILDSEQVNWRKQVFARDKFTCILSNKCGNVEAHHIFNYKDYPDKRYDINNGITLHKSVHRLFHKLYGNRNNTLEQFEEFKNNYLTNKYE